MLTKTKIALAVALIAGTASAALANDSGENDRGGYVLPGSTDGVNPVYHPRWFPNYQGSAVRAADTGNGGQAYGYIPAAKPKHRVTHVRTQDNR